jgi:hypothetical protein
MTRFYQESCTNSYRGNHHTKIKMERDSPDADDYDYAPTFSSGAGIPIATVMTANENWRGKNDPAERRRIQNRLNQRAFRQRQRAGESPKQYKPRSGSRSAESQQQDSEDEADSPQSDTSLPAANAEGQSTFEPTEGSSSSGADAQAGRVYDELARIINRNFVSAAVANAQHIGVDLAALQSGTSVKTPRSSNRRVPQSLSPVELQHQLAHDPIIDTIPHARLRFNILRGIATGQVDASDFSKSIRASGALEVLNGTWQRGGVVVWNEPEQPSSWELSEIFVRQWYSLLQGCEDLIAATNAWRSRRNEKLFPTRFNTSQGSSSS